MRKFGYVQQVVEDFFNSEEPLMVVSILPETYSSVNSARCAYRCAIKRLGYNIVVRLIQGDMYLIRVKNTNWTAKSQGKACSKCSRRYPSKYCALCNNLSNYREKDHD